jgi:hypothetical protein
VRGDVNELHTDADDTHLWMDMLHAEYIVPSTKTNYNSTAEPLRMQYTMWFNKLVVWLLNINLRMQHDPNRSHILLVNYSNEPPYTNEAF